MGEHVEPNVFRIVDISVQHSGGSRACFVRHPHEHQADLDRFFKRTSADYMRFNYLGEWHSHPSFLPLPSTTDLDTMQSIVDDPKVGANFLVLLIVKLEGRREMQVSATAFVPGLTPHGIDVGYEPDGDAADRRNSGIVAWVRNLFTR